MQPFRCSPTITQLFVGSRPFLRPCAHQGTPHRFFTCLEVLKCQLYMCCMVQAADVPHHVPKKAVQLTVVRESFRHCHVTSYLRPTDVPSLSQTKKQLFRFSHRITQRFVRSRPGAHPGSGRAPASPEEGPKAHRSPFLVLALTRHVLIHVQLTSRPSATQKRNRSGQVAE